MGESLPKAKRGVTYKEAGVDIDAGTRAVELIREAVEGTFREGVLGEFGGFGGLFELDLNKYRKPVLVSGTDSVGTKLKVAFIMDKHDTVGVDAVAMCVNDILTCGAEPLFFLDYIGCSKLEPEKVAKIVEGIAEGCRRAGCALIGGETAELPGFYQEGEYDLSGFAVGVVEKEKIIDGSKVTPGDKIIGLASSGLHSNGYSLVRKILFEIAGYKVSDYVPELGKTLGEELLVPTKIYVKPVLELLKEFELKGIAHITGGGMIDNIPRILPQGTKAVIDTKSWEVPPIFNLLQKLGQIEEREMRWVFNMGIGLLLIVSEDWVEGIIRRLDQFGERAYLIGEIEEGDKKVAFV